MLRIILKKDNTNRLKLALIAWGVVALCFVYLKETNLIESSYTLFVIYSTSYWLIQTINLFIRENKTDSHTPLILVHLSGLFLFFILMNYRWVFIPVLVYMFPLYITMTQKEYIKTTYFSYLPLILLSIIDYIFITKKYLKQDILVLALSGLMSIVFRQSNKVYNFQKKIIEEKNRELTFKNKIREEELLLAKKIQNSIIPIEEYQIDNLKVEKIYKPIEELGGDFFDIIKKEKGIFFFISDVSGHGIPAALITMMVKAYLESEIKNTLDPKKILETLNKRIINKTNNNFITAFAAFYEKKEKKLIYTKAAHVEPILIRENNIIRLEGKGKFLGVFEEINLERKEIQLYKKDKIIIFTDGILEINKDGKEFENRFYDIIMENSGLSIKELFNKIKQECETLKEVMHDDICIVGFEVE